MFYFMPFKGKLIILFIALGILVPFVFTCLPADRVLAVELAGQCAQISESSSGCPNMSPAECKTLLEQCANYYDQQSELISQDITKTTQQKNTLQNQVSTLKKKIQNLEYQINQSNVKVSSLNIQITDTKDSIDRTAEDIADSQSQITTILRSIYEEDKKPSFIILLEGNLSDFFSNVAYLEGLNKKVNELLQSTIDLQSYLGGQKDKMDGEVDQLQKTIALQTLQKKENEQNKTEQQKYLNLTEAQYQQQLADKKDLDAKKAKIQALLFSIVGVSDTEAPTFGQALEIAKTAASMVGVRPAFLLAIISQESAIGRNVGQCVLVNPDTGDGKKIKTGATVIRIMKPTRDVPPFLEITQSLGRDPYNTPVSCWIPAYVKGSPYGWGGAMGPAQFIPSTWKLFEDRLRSLLGKTPDPWGIKDSFTASALYLSDLGASAQTSAKESNAASRYYGGSSAYARSVMSRANCIQTFIDNGTMSTSCENLIF
jgi:peptidoglycan hydrolase CwlO-like protein